MSIFHHRAVQAYAFSMLRCHHRLHHCVSITDRPLTSRDENPAVQVLQPLAHEADYSLTSNGKQVIWHYKEHVSDLHYNTMKISITWC